MIIGALALAGVYPLSGFFSKEAVLGTLAAQPSKIWLYAALVGAFLTAYYSFRLIFFILLPKDGVEEKHPDPHAHEHKEEHHGSIFWAMAIPVMILAVVTLVLGHLEHPLQNFITGSGGAAHTVQALPVQHAAGHEHTAPGGISHELLLGLGVSAGLLGILLAWFEFGRKGAARNGFLSYFPSVWKLFDCRWFLDAFYRKALDSVVYGGLTSLFTKNDRRIIDGGVDGICYFTEAAGRIFSFLQSGMLQYNLLIMTLAAGAAILIFLV
jgi:NADH-quinone oxidoreductase subunit L